MRIGKEVTINDVGLNENNIITTVVAFTLQKQHQRHAVVCAVNQIPKATYGTIKTINHVARCTLFGLHVSIRGTRKLNV